MKLPLHRAGDFNADFDQQFRWYLKQAGEELAERFLEAVLITLRSLAKQPDLGRSRKFRHPSLRNLRSFRVNPPFDKILIFYRVRNDTLEAWRLMHGARDLPRRLVEPPGAED
ncbi:MAG TPA: type II toxin-antitoxin system RelE/ParE family toxin [Verrucomicrobiae bacterium]|nr:type II toxin-antitoxin system RelE/ParE family toxin [Verrucomicrobiae bacterium]